MATTTADLPGFVRSRHDDIVQAWLDQTTTTDTGEDLARSERRELMERLLGALGSDGDVGERLHDEVERQVQGHGVRGLALFELIQELARIEAIVLDVSERLPPSERLPASEVVALAQVVRRATVAASGHFRDRVTREERRDKRYLDHLQHVADAALRAPDAPLADRLDEVLGLIMEAMGAQSAALLLYDAGAEQLVTHAATGRAAEELRELTNSLDPGQFTGQVARGETPLSLAASSAELGVTEPMRRAGIRAIFGVRLPPTLRLVGVMFVGLSERAHFTPRETARLAMLGQWLTLQLDNAELFAELRGANAHLSAEREARERSVAMLGHDVRGPLTAGRMAVQLVLRDPQLGLEHREALARADQNLGAVERMLRNLLDVYTVQSGELLPLRLAPTDLVEVAANTLTELERLHGRRFALAGDRSVVGHWSSDEIARALWNLLTNAVKYGTPGTRIVVRCENRGDHAELSVSNEGPVIPPARIAALEEGKGGRRAATGEGGSWGLGLMVVQAVAVAHGGRLTVRSDEGGATFTIELPYDREAPSGEE